MSASFLSTNTDSLLDVGDAIFIDAEIIGDMKCFAGFKVWDFADGPRRFSFSSCRLGFPYASHCNLHMPESKKDLRNPPSKNQKEPKDLINKKCIDD